MLYKAIPQFFMELMAKYFRLNVEGVENLPKEGPVIVTPNHSGFSGLDAMLLSYLIHQQTSRAAWVLTHHFWFLTKATSIPAHKLGFIEATKKNGKDYLKKKQIIVLFPEGEYGNFKPTTKAYRLQEFKRGFVRLALETQSPIIPTIVIGAEETHINLRSLKFTKYLRGMVLPLPLNFLPLPAKWKIRFLEPIKLPYKPEAAKDKELVHEIANDIRGKMQAAITEELQKRESIYF
ncbi:MAG: acyltransferase family protein [Bdellovibrionaceae bacterium]|nr:acyltransferase family protein [Pseudobdellovibrionaceae bacterium]